MIETQKFFVSFNSADKDKAEWIAWVLKEAGHEVAFHAWEVGAGEDIPHWMNEKLAWADRLIAIVSPDYLNATYSKQEWQAQIWDDPDGKDGAVIPILVQHIAEWPPLLRGRKRIELTGLDEDRARRRLLDEIKAPSVPQHKPSFQPESSGQAQNKPDHPDSAPSTKPDFVVARVGPDPSVKHDPSTISRESGDLPGLFFQHLGPLWTGVLMCGMGVAFLLIAKAEPNQWWGEGIEEACAWTDWRTCADGYIFNLSLSISSVLVLPFLFGFMMRAYRNLPNACGYIGGQTLVTEVKSKINQRWVTALYASALVMWVVHLDSGVKNSTWTWQDFTAPCAGTDNCSFVSAFGNFSLLGGLTTAYLGLLGLFVVFLARSCLAGKVVVEELSSGRSELRVFDADHFFGLRRLRDVTKDMYAVMALSFVFIGLYMLDKFYVQNRWQGALVITLIFVVTWIAFFSIVRKSIALPIRQLIDDCKSAENERLSTFIEQRQARGEPYDGLLASRAAVESLPDRLVKIRSWAITLPIVLMALVGITAAILLSSAT